MKRRIIIFTILSFLGFQLIGCATMTETEKGAAVGAVAGGVLGAILGNTKGAVIDTFAGAIAGAVIGNYYDRQKGIHLSTIEFTLPADLDIGDITPITIGGQKKIVKGHFRLLEKQSVVMGILAFEVVSGKKTYFIQPLVEYKDGMFNSLLWYFNETGSDSKEKAKARKIKHLLLNIPTYWLYDYDKGSVVGRFEVNNILPSELYPDCGGPHIGVGGKVSWEKGYILQSEREIEIGGIEEKKIEKIKNVIVLSRLVTQPSFLLRKKDLSREQISSVDNVLHTLIKRAPLLLKDTQWPLDTTLIRREIKVMDINKDGKPEVYATGYSKMVTKGEVVYPEVIACVFLTWKDNKWIVLKRTTALSEGETILEGEFSVEAVADIEGDGIAELILEERSGYEVSHLRLYRLQNEKLVNVLDIGTYGF